MTCLFRALAALWRWFSRSTPRKRKRPYGKRLRADRRVRWRWQRPMKDWLRRARRGERSRT